MEAPAPGQPMEFIALPSTQPAVTPPPSGSAPTQPEPSAAAPPTPAPPVTPATLPPTPAPIPQPTPDPTPAPVLPTAPSAITLPAKSNPTPKKEKPVEKPKEKSEPAPTTEATSTPVEKPTPPTPHHPKINLTEVTRTEAPSASASSAHPAHVTAKAQGSGEGAGLQPSGVENALSKALEGAGVAEPIVVGAPGGGGGQAGSWYYGLIREQMYAAWNQPVELSGQHLRAKIEIKVAADGTVSGVSLSAGSGNATFDQSALAAARKVLKISKPRPNDIPETVGIEFKLAE